MRRRRNDSWFVALALSAALLLSGAGCAPSGASSPAGAAQPAAATAAEGSGVPAASASGAREQIRVSYAAISTSFSPGWIARDTGIFAKYGLEAEVTHLPSRQAST